MKIAVLCGLVGCGAVAAEEPPDLELLEYLGSWEESDEEWLLFDTDAQEAAAQEEAPQNDRAADRAPKSATVDEESTELEKNES